MHHLPYHLNKLFSPPHTHTIHSVFMSSYHSHNKQLIFPHISNGTVFIMKIECVICEVRTGFVCIIRMYLNAKAGVWSRGSSCGIWGGQSGSGKAFSPSTCVSPCQYHSTNDPHSSSSTCCSYLKDERAKPGNLPNQQCCFGNREGFDGK